MDRESAGEIPESDRLPCGEEQTVGVRCGDCDYCLGLKSYRLDRDAIERGLTIFATSTDCDIVYYFVEWLRENDDAHTGDAFLQLCLFGKLKYG